MHACVDQPAATKETNDKSLRSCRLMFPQSMQQQQQAQPTFLLTVTTYYLLSSTLSQNTTQQRAADTIHTTRLCFVSKRHRMRNEQCNWGTGRLVGLGHWGAIVQSGSWKQQLQFMTPAKGIQECHNSGLQ